jgi:hypothetical protein
MSENLETKGSVLDRIISGEYTPKFHAVNYNSPEKQQELRELLEQGKQIMKRKEYKPKYFPRMI